MPQSRQPGERRDHRSQPPSFEAFAEHYDHYTAGYQAAAWTGKLEALLLEQGLCGDRLLDAGCGTGKSFIPMRERGWNVVGCDLSPAMLEIAREKVRSEVRLEVADVRELPKFGDFDLVWALNDTLNNVLGVEEPPACCCSTSTRWRYIRRSMHPASPAEAIYVASNA